MNELAFSTFESSGSPCREIGVAHLRVSYNIDVGLPRHGVPYSIPRDQAYYWSGDWQADIRASHAELVSGDYVEFDSDDPTDIIRWFLSDR